MSLPWEKEYRIGTAQGTGKPFVGHGGTVVRRHGKPPDLPGRTNSRLTGMAVVEVSREGVASAGFRPAVIPPDNVPRHVMPDSAEGKQVTEYLQRCITEAGLNCRLGEAGPAGGLPDDCIQVMPPETTNHQARS